MIQKIDLFAIVFLMLFLKIQGVNYYGFNIAWPKPVLHLPGPHPSYDLENLMPAGKEWNVGGIDFLPDGRLAMAIFMDPGYFKFTDSVGRGF